MRVQHSKSKNFTSDNEDSTWVPGVGALLLVHVNRQPEFDEENIDLTLYEAPVAHEYTLANWSNPVVAGAAVGGGAELTELPQQVI